MKPEESFVGQSIRSLQTMLRVIAEADGIIPTLVPDGIYGQNTVNAVSAFQRRYGLPVTGVTDQGTWDRVVAVYEPAYVRIGPAQPIEVLLEPNQVLRRGDRDPYLFLLQAMLAFLSTDYTDILPPVVSGTLDADTERALGAFQLLVGLPATGELDRLTWKHLAQQFALLAAHQLRF